MTKLLFVCIGNSCRSQMAEGFARKYGSDVVNVWSAGLAPAPIVQPLTVQVMERKNIDIRDQFPKSVDELELNSFDMIINISGVPLPWPLRGEVRRWNVSDPMAQAEEIYIRVRDQIEALVMQLILDLRRSVRTPTAPLRPVPVRAERAAPASDPDRTSQSSQRFGFGRVRRARD